MQTPWDGWTAAVKGGFALAETWAASVEVVARRVGIIDAALANPAKGDWRELNRMVPEKLDAFGKAGAATLIDLARLQADALAAWASLAGMATAGRLPTPRQTGALLSRIATGQVHAAGAGGRALAPIHRRATANARRLRKG